MPTPKPVCPRPRRGALGTGLAYRRGRADGTQLGIWKGDRPVPPRGTLHAATGVLARERDGRDAETPEEKAPSRERRPDAAGGPRSAPGRMWHLDSQRPCSRAARQDVSPRLSHWVCVTLRCQDGKTNTAPATVLRMIKQDGAKEELMGRGAERGRHPAAGPGPSPGRPCAPLALPPRQAARSPGPDRLPGPAPVRRPRSPHGALRSQGPPWACVCFPLTLWGSQALRKRLAPGSFDPRRKGGARRSSG